MGDIMLLLAIVYSTDVAEAVGILTSDDWVAHRGRLGHHSKPNLGGGKFMSKLAL